MTEAGSSPARAETLPLAAGFEPRHGEAVPVAEGVFRVTAPNPGPFTFHGTNSYVLDAGEGAVVVDPGPDEPAHLAALLAALGGRRVEAVLLTHRHRDHTALVPRLLDATGDPPLFAGAPSAEMSSEGGLDAALDRDLRPGRILAGGEALRFGSRAVEVVATPGHAADHLAFALADGVLLSGDHVMGWSTTVVAPPDGSMRDYMASLDVLLARDDRLFLPGHGGAVEAPRRLLRGLKSHRLMREAAILQRLAAGDGSVGEIVAALYRDVDPRLHAAAGLSVLAHLEDLAARGLAACEAGPPRLDARFRPAG